MHVNGFTRAVDYIRAAGVSRTLQVTLIAGMSCAAVAASKAADFSYRVAGSWSAPDALWDYASVDSQAKRLYVGRVGGVLSVDLGSQVVTPVLVKSTLVHGVAPLPNGLAAASNGEDDTVSIFNGKTGEILGTTPAGKGPDSIVYDPSQGLVAVTDEDGRAISLIDPTHHTAAGTIELRGKPEAIVPDGRGLLYGNIDDKAEVVVVDVAKRTVTQRIELPECDRPTGIAHDALRHVILSVCRNGVVNFIAAQEGQIITTLKLGAGPDAVFIDSKRAVAFVPSGGTGTLSVIALAPDGHGTLVQTLPTQAGSRTGAVDIATGTVYLPAAKLVAPKKPGQWPTVETGTFRILVVQPAENAP